MVEGIFSVKTANGPLRYHLEVRHTLVYLEMLEKNRWNVQSKLLKAAFSAGHSYNSLRLALSNPEITINSLPPPPPLQPGDSTPAGIGQRPKADLGAGLPEFSLAVLQDCLVKFIVEYDEVCNIVHSCSVPLIVAPICQAINVVECPAFRRLLLVLRQDLQDSDIPHRTKVHDLIVTAWEKCFDMIKLELKASC